MVPHKMVICVVTLLLLSILVSSHPVFVRTLEANTHPLNADCSLNGQVFDRDWIKYSDFDDAIPVGERSFEAKQHQATLINLLEQEHSLYLLGRDQTMEGLMRQEARALIQAIRRNQQQNLIKAFIRLSWLTHSTIKGARGLGKSYGTALAEAEVLPQIVQTYSFIKGLAPKNSPLDANTAKTKTLTQQATDKVTKIGSKGALAAITSLKLRLGDPTDVGVALIQETLKQALPTPDVRLTDAEVKILRDHYEQKKELQTALLKSYEVARERRLMMTALQDDLIPQLQGELTKWEKAEKQRTEVLLVAGCRETSGPPSNELPFGVYLAVERDDVLVGQKWALEAIESCYLRNWGTDCSKTVGEVTALRLISPATYATMQEATIAFCAMVAKEPPPFSPPLAPLGFLKATLTIDGQYHWVSNAPPCAA